MRTKELIKNNTVFESFQNAIAGLEYLLTTQRNARIHLAATFVVFASSIYLKLSLKELGILCLACGLVFSMEAMNTAVETVVDLVTKDYHVLAGRAKDVAAGSVLLSSIFAVVSWLCVCAPKLIILLK